jgi:hypothetical protein
MTSVASATASVVVVGEGTVVGGTVVGDTFIRDTVDVVDVGSTEVVVTAGNARAGRRTLSVVDGESTTDVAVVVADGTVVDVVASTPATGNVVVVDVVVVEGSTFVGRAVVAVETVPLPITDTARIRIA